jgi:hypothetical protein
MTGRDRDRPKLIPRDPPLVTVRFREGINPSRGAQATSEVAGRPDARWDDLSRLFPGLTLAPLFDRHDAAAIRRLEERATSLTPGYRSPRFDAMFRVRLPPRAQWEHPAPPDGDVAGELRRLLLETLPIDRVSVETVLAPLPKRDSDIAANPDVEHLDKADKGVDVDAAWTVAGGQGKGEVLADIERGWHTGHVEFTGVKFIELPGGEQEDGDVPHGTQALSVALARENKQYVLGVAPQVETVVLSAEKRVATGDHVTEEALLDAVVELVTSHPMGSVLLIEVEKAIKDFLPAAYAGALKPELLGPVEMKAEVFDVIQLAVANHIVVVEPAGNGGSEDAALGMGLDLDSADGAALLHGDSGAILVGQSYWIGGVQKEVPLGCTGMRIDCFAWGDSVDAASVTPDTPDPITGESRYKDAKTAGFNGTSSASAIIAGTALVVQGLVRNGIAGVLGYLPPPMMRAVLGHVKLNTALSGGVTNVIGVMPDLAAIVPWLRTLPDLYVRDNLLDTGDPHAGLLARSPDIILKNVALPAGTTPDAAFGEGSGTEDDEELSDTPVAGNPAWVYVRVANRGLSDVTGATVTVWYAASGTFLHPGSWVKIGSVPIDVPQGDTLKVTDAIAWPAVPAGVGHFCFVALVEHPDDPGFLSGTFSIPSTSSLSVPAEFNDIEYFKAYMRNQNNVAYRNFNVVEVAAAAATAAVVEAEVAAPDGGGGGGGGGEVELRVDGRLPPGATLELELPEPLALAVKPPAAFKVDPATKARRGMVAASGVTLVGRGPLKGKKKQRVKLHITLPNGLKKRTHVSVVQLHKGQVVGRVTWRLKPKP